jgi:hypothetical protein
MRSMSMNWPGDSESVYVIEVRVVVLELRGDINDGENIEALLGEVVSCKWELLSSSFGFTGEVIDSDFGSMVVKDLSDNCVTKLGLDAEILEAEERVDSVSLGLLVELDAEVGDDEDDDRLRGMRLTKRLVIQPMAPETDTLFNGSPSQSTLLRAERRIATGSQVAALTSDEQLQ